MSTTPSSSVQRAREVLGQRLREVRLDAGLTARALAARCGWHESKSSRIERGLTTASESDIRAWTLHCQAPEQADELITQARGIDGMYVEWRRMERAGLKAAQEAVNPLFSRAYRFRVYSPWIIPGLLQTGAYTTSLLRATARQRGHSEDVGEAVAVRLDRQRVLHQGRTFAFVIEEHVLYKRIGTSEEMAGQLGHLIAAAALPAVSIGIIPNSGQRDETRPVEGFWVFDDSQVSVELVSAYLTVTHPHEVALYADAFTQLSALAVYGGAARNLVTTAIAALS